MLGDGGVVYPVPGSVHMADPDGAVVARVRGIVERGRHAELMDEEPAMQRVAVIALGLSVAPASMTTVRLGPTHSPHWCVRGGGAVLLITAQPWGDCKEDIS